MIICSFWVSPGCSQMWPGGFQVWPGGCRTSFMLPGWDTNSCDCILARSLLLMLWQDCDNFSNVKYSVARCDQVIHSVKCDQQLPLIMIGYHMWPETYITNNVVSQCDHGVTRSDQAVARCDQVVARCLYMLPGVTRIPRVVARHSSEVTSCCLLWPVTDFVL